MNIVKPNYKPILFRGELVRRIMDGEKTQTRRVITPQPEANGPGVYGDRYAGGPDWGFWMPKPDNRMYSPQTWRCPYGEPGDRLWVRETWRCHGGRESEYLQGPGTVRYRADADAVEFLQAEWRPSIFMPRWACRLELELVKVRVEHLQDISEADAKAEGARHFPDIPDPHPYKQGSRWSMEPNPQSTDFCLGTARFAFANGWNTINEKRGYGWEANPWLWVLDFERVK